MDLEACTHRDDAEIVKKSKGALWILKDMPQVVRCESSRTEIASERASADEASISFADDETSNDYGGPVAKGPSGPPTPPNVVKKSNEKIFHRSRSKKEKNKNGIVRELEPSNIEKVVDGTWTPAAKKQKHIMISYQWMYKTIVLRIAEALKSAGHKVWVDVEQMSKKITGK